MSAQIATLPNQGPNSHEINAFSYTPPTNRTWYGGWPISYYPYKEQIEGVKALIEKADIKIPEEILALIEKDNLSHKGLSADFLKVANLAIAEKIILPKLLATGHISSIIRYHPETRNPSDKWIMVPKESFAPNNILQIINEETYAGHPSLNVRVESARIILPVSEGEIQGGTYASINLQGSKRTSRAFLEGYEDDDFFQQMDKLRIARGNIGNGEFIITPSAKSSSIHMIPFRQEVSRISERERLTEIFLKNSVPTTESIERRQPKRELPIFGPIYSVSILKPDQ